jgi:hypothetical protein
MVRVVIKIGDVFQVRTTEDRVKYFQYIGVDETQLGSAVVRAFKQDYSVAEGVDLALVTQGEIDFHAHSSIRTGIRMERWTKAGKAPVAEEVAPMFRDTYDYGRAVWQEPILVSDNWVVWHINQPFQNVGKLEGKNQQAEIGLVMSPDAIVHRMRHGAYDMPFYPAF